MAERSKRATQMDIAQRVGVSQATVSMVLGGAPPSSISAETYERVVGAARELGYVPNRSAQALRTSRTKTIAVVVPDISNPFYPSLLRGVQSVADRARYDVMTVNTDGNAEHETRFLRWALEGRIDGVVGIFFTINSKDFEPLTKA